MAGGVDLPGTMTHAVACACGPARCSGIRRRLGEQDYFECEWDRRHLVIWLVLYFCIVLSLERSTLKRDDTYWWCTRVHTSWRTRCLVCYFGICGRTRRAPVRAERGTGQVKMVGSEGAVMISWRRKPRRV